MNGGGGCSVSSEHRSREVDHGRHLCLKPHKCPGWTLPSSHNYLFFLLGESKPDPLKYTNSIKTDWTSLLENLSDRPRRQDRFADIARLYCNHKSCIIYTSSQTRRVLVVRKTGNQKKSLKKTFQQVDTITVVGRSATNPLQITVNPLEKPNGLPERLL